MSTTMNYPMTHQGVRDLDRPRQQNSSGSVNVGPSERVLSAVCGAAMTFLGIYQRGFLGTVMAIGGGVVAYRGITGHCEVYNACGINTNR